MSEWATARHGVPGGAELAKEASLQACFGRVRRVAEKKQLRGHFPYLGGIAPVVNPASAVTQFPAVLRRISLVSGGEDVYPRGHPISASISRRM